MAKRVTKRVANSANSDSNDRKAVTIYPTNDVIEAYILNHIELQYRLGRYIDKTMHCDAVLTVGMRHMEELKTEIEKNDPVKKRRSKLSL